MLQSLGRELWQLRHGELQVLVQGPLCHPLEAHLGI